MTGIVLAGGESRRMGADKAFLKIDGLPMVEHVIRTLRTTVNHIIVVTNTPDAYASHDVEVTRDAFTMRGSLWREISSACFGRVRPALPSRA
ncbi:MAG: NTP transferase domain-containing protein [Nitrospiraceae bacterium]|nr:NTP transferase domain-containing protein [Nitrospiraceae bacterium]